MRKRTTGSFPCCPFVVGMDFRLHPHRHTGRPLHGSGAWQLSPRLVSPTKGIHHLHPTVRAVRGNASYYICAKGKDFSVLKAVYPANSTVAIGWVEGK